MAGEEVHSLPAYNGNVKLLIREVLIMGVSAQCPRRSWRLGGLFGLLLAGLLLAPGAALGLEAQPWVLRDQAGRVWSLTLLEQGDPAYPAGRRLRLTDRSGTQQLDHDRPLQLRDGMGGAWELANYSNELVPAGEEVLPAGSAQFDLAGLEPRPRAELPLALEVPLTAGDTALLMAGAAAVAALHGA
jgi:hypothetical protein